MIELLAIMAFLLAFTGICLGSAVLHRVNAQHAGMTVLNERLLALEVELADQRHTQDNNIKTLKALEARAQSLRVEAENKDFIPSHVAVREKKSNVA